MPSHPPQNSSGLIILDHVLAKGICLDYLPDSRNCCRFVPVIIVSGALEVQQQIGALQGPRRAHYCVTKPLDVDELCGRLISPSRNAAKKKSSASLKLWTIQADRCRIALQPLDRPAEPAKRDPQTLERSNKKRNLRARAEFAWPADHHAGSPELIRRRRVAAEFFPNGIRTRSEAPAYSSPDSL